MRCLYKYPVAAVVELPLGAIVRAAGPQGPDNTTYLWAEVDPNTTKTQKRFFQLFATGETIPDLHWARWEWVATWQEPPYVWHLYEKRS